MVRVSVLSGYLSWLIVIAWIVYFLSLTVLTAFDSNSLSHLREIRFLRLHDIRPDQFKDDFVFSRVPVVFKNYIENELIDYRIKPEEWTFNKLKQRFRNVQFRQGAAPYPNQTIKLNDKDVLDSKIRIFQFGTLPATFSLGLKECLPVFGIKYIHTDFLHEIPRVACQLLEGMHVPFIIRQFAPLVPLGGLIMGGKDVETTPHAHESAINLLIHGKKRWVIDGVNPFIQKAGDLVFIPMNAEHAVVNLEPSVAWTFQFHENHFGTSVGVSETLRLIDKWKASNAS